MEYSHPISPCKSEKYDATFGTKITVCLKKIGGMMLWIMSSTFKNDHGFILKRYFKPISWVGLLHMRLGFARPERTDAIFKVLSRLLCTAHIDSGMTSLEPRWQIGFVTVWCHMSQPIIFSSKWVKDFFKLHLSDRKNYKDKYSLSILRESVLWN